MSTKGSLIIMLKERSDHKRLCSSKRQKVQEMHYVNFLLYVTCVDKRLFDVM